MTTPFLGEIQIFGFPFAPLQWAFANGTTMSIQQSTTLYALLGTFYGGNGTTNFQLPNLMGRASCNQGQGPALTQRTIGEDFGAFNIALDPTTMPSHQHPMVANNPPTGATPSATPVSGAELARFGGTNALVPNNPAATTMFAPGAVAPAGGSVPHLNQQPFLALNFCIALSGAFPSFD